MTAITVIEKEGKLKEIKKRSGTSVKPGWEVRLESRVEAIRRKLSYTYVLQECYRKQEYTKNQKNIRRKIEKQYGKATTTRLQQVQTQLKQKLKVEGKKLKKRRIIRERRYIDRMFKIAPKKCIDHLKVKGSNHRRRYQLRMKQQTFGKRCGATNDNIKKRLRG